MGVQNTTEAHLHSLDIVYSGIYICSKVFFPDTSLCHVWHLKLANSSSGKASAWVALYLFIFNNIIP